MRYQYLDFGFFWGWVANNQQMNILKYIFLILQCLLAFLQKALLRKRAAWDGGSFLRGLQQDKTRLIFAHIRVLTRQACYDMARRVKMAYNENLTDCSSIS